MNPLKKEKSRSFLFSVCSTFDKACAKVLSLSKAKSALVHFFTPEVTHQTNQADFFCCFPLFTDTNLLGLPPALDYWVVLRQAFQRSLEPSRFSFFLLVCIGVGCPCVRRPCVGSHSSSLLGGSMWCLLPWLTSLILSLNLGSVPYWWLLVASSLRLMVSTAPSIVVEHSLQGRLDAPTFRGRKESWLHSRTKEARAPFHAGGWISIY